MEIRMSQLCPWWDSLVQSELSSVHTTAGPNVLVTSACTSGTDAHVSIHAVEVMHPIGFSLGLL